MANHGEPQALTRNCISQRNSHHDAIGACKRRRHNVQLTAIDSCKPLDQDDRCDFNVLVDLSEVWDFVRMKEEISALADKLLRGISQYFCY